MPETRIRADVARNRRRLLAAGREAISEHGVNVAMSTIATRAGLGSATLYRHFPTREMLIASVFEADLKHCLDILDRANATPDPLDGLREAISGMIQMGTERPGFTEAVIAGNASPDALTGFRNRTARGLEQLARRLRAHEAVGSDFTSHDIILILTAARAAAAAQGMSPERSARRMLTLLERGFLRDPVRSDTVRPISPELSVGETGRPGKDRRATRS